MILLCRAQHVHVAVRVTHLCQEAVWSKFPPVSDFSFLLASKLYTYIFPFCGYSPDAPHLASVVSGSGKNNFSPLVQCTSHMCPVRIHWHVKLNYKEYWRVKVTITNFNYRMNYSEWNMVVQHPNFDNLTQLFSFNYKSLTPYGSISKCGNLFVLNFYS